MHDYTGPSAYLIKEPFLSWVNWWLSLWNIDHW